MNDEQEVTLSDLEKFVEPSDVEILIPIYDGVDLLDVTVPYEVFNWVNSLGRSPAEKVQVQIVSEHLGEEGQAIIQTRDGFPLVSSKSFEAYLSVLQTETGGARSRLIWVPGGSPEALQEQMQNETFMHFIQAVSQHCKYVCSVCEGAMLLAQAGLLDGYRVTTHWAFIPCLTAYPNINVVEGHPRVHIDRNRITGGGVSAGLDEALKIVELLFDQSLADKIQKSIQYLPHIGPDRTHYNATVCPLPNLNDHQSEPNGWSSKLASKVRKIKEVGKRVKRSNNQ